MSKPRLTILVGAGASMDFGVPGVGELTRRVNAAARADARVKHQKGDIALDMIVAKLEDLFGAPDEVNFERIYHVVNRLMQHARDPGAAIGMYRPIMHPFMAPMPPELSEDPLRAVERRYLMHLFQIVAAASAKPDVAPIAKFLAELRRDYLVRIYSLNYDNLLHRAAPDLYTGFGVGPSPRRFDGPSFLANRNSDALFQMHGSIHLGFEPRRGDLGEPLWFETVDEAFKSADYSGSGRRQADGTFIEPSPIISGLEKSASVLTVPFSFYFSEFLGDLVASDAILVIGYGLGDPHINAQIKTARNDGRGPKLIAIDCFDWLDYLHGASPKVGDYTHILGAPIVDHQSMRPIKGTRWLTSSEYRSAVWYGGFAELMRLVPDAGEMVRQIV